MLNMREKIFSLAIACLLSAAPVLAAEISAADNTAGASIAVGSGGNDQAFPGKKCHGRMFRTSERFSFSDSQLEQMSALKNQFMDKTASKFSELGSLHRQLKDVLSQKSIDGSKAESIQSKINSLKDDIALGRLKLKIDETAVLTPDQREHMRRAMLVSEVFGNRFNHSGHSGPRHSFGKHFEHGGDRPERT